MQEFEKFRLHYSGKDFHYYVLDNGYVFFAYLTLDATEEPPNYFPDAILMVRKGNWEIDNFDEDVEVLKVLAREIYNWQFSKGNQLAVDSENPRFIQRSINISSQVSL